MELKRHPNIEKMNVLLDCRRAGVTVSAIELQEEREMLGIIVSGATQLEVCYSMSELLWCTWIN